MFANPGPATDTIYCIRNVLLNTIYGFLFCMAYFTLPQIGEMFGEIFRTEFCFSPRYFACFARGSGHFSMFLLLQKYGLGKLLSVNDLLRLFELKFLRFPCSGRWRLWSCGWRASARKTPRADLRLPLRQVWCCLLIDFSLIDVVA